MIGLLLDRYGPRVVLSMAALLSGGALMACSTLQTRGHFVVLLVPLNLWQQHLPAAPGPTVSTASFGHAVHHQAFWMLCLAHCCMTITMTMVNVYLVSFLVGWNW